MKLRDQRASLAVKRERLARTIRELTGSGTIRKLVDELATSRRECREKQGEIDSLNATNAQPLAASSPSPEPDDQASTGPLARDQRHEPAAALSPDEHGLAWMASPELALRRGNLALKEENTSLRLELAAYAQQTPDGLASRRRDTGVDRGRPD